MKEGNEPQYERQLEADFRELVRKELGGKVVKLAPTERGVPDRLVLLPGGRMELVELKTADGHLSPIQIAWHEEAAALGTHVTVLYGRAGINMWTTMRRHCLGEPQSDARVYWDGPMPDNEIVNDPRLQGPAS